MAGDTLAQFRGTFDDERAEWRGPREGSVTLTRDRLVLDDGEQSVTIPLQAIFDINPGSQPQVFDPLGGPALTVAYEADERRVAAVAGKTETIRKFTTAIFKTVLDDTIVLLKHPARRGGRVTNATFEPGMLSLAAGGVVVDTDSRTVRIETASVVGFGRQRTSVDGTERPTLVVRHMDAGTAMTTHVATESDRQLSLLGRYLRRQYDDLLASVRNLSLSRVEIRALVTIYTATDVAVADVLGLVEGQRTQLFDALLEKSLIRPEDGRPELTTRGQVVVNHYIDEVNS